MNNRVERKRRYPQKIKVKIDKTIEKREKKSKSRKLSVQLPLRRS